MRLLPSGGGLVCAYFLTLTNNHPQSVRITSGVALAGTTDGKWIYDVTALPKPGMVPTPDTDKITLVKLWKTTRPAPMFI